MPLYTNQPRHAESRVTFIAGSFAPAGVSAPTAPLGNSFTVARTNVGEYTLTLDRVYLQLVSATATVQLASVANLNMQVGTVNLAARTVVLTALAGATPTEIAANANNRVHFSLQLRDSTL
jgi:hypothetical protein